MESFTTETGKASGRGVGAIVIDRPMAEVWSVVSHFPTKRNTCRGWKSRSVGSDQRATPRENDRRCRGEHGALHSHFSISQAQHTIDFQLDKSASDNTIKDTVGGYALFEVSTEKTLLVYRTWVDTGSRDSALCRRLTCRASRFPTCCTRSKASKAGVFIENNSRPLGSFGKVAARELTARFLSLTPDAVLGAVEQALDQPETYAPPDAVSSMPAWKTASMKSS